MQEYHPISLWPMTYKDEKTWKAMQSWSNFAETTRESNRKLQVWLRKFVHQQNKASLVVEITKFQNCCIFIVRSQTKHELKFKVLSEFLSV